jgi:hypothetical protein
MANITARRFHLRWPSSRFPITCAVRMSLMRERVIYVFTHDSIGVGEDEPRNPSTRRQPAIDPQQRRVAPLRCSGTMIAWLTAIGRRDGPTCLICRGRTCRTSIRTGCRHSQNGYVLAITNHPAVTLLACGSGRLACRPRALRCGRNRHVISMPIVRLDRGSTVPQSCRVCGTRHRAGVLGLADHTNFDGDVVGIDRWRSPRRPRRGHLGLTPRRHGARAAAGAGLVSVPHPHGLGALARDSLGECPNSRR